MRIEQITKIFCDRITEIESEQDMRYMSSTDLMGEIRSDFRELLTILSTYRADLDEKEIYEFLYANIEETNLLLDEVNYYFNRNQEKSNVER